MAVKNFSIELLGDAELNRKFMLLSVKMERKFLKKSYRVALKGPLAKMRADAPVQYGKLKKTLKINVPRSRKQHIVSTGIRTGRREELGISKDAKGYYPSSQQFGWERPKGRRHDPQPYMRENFNAARPAMTQAIIDSLRKQINAEIVKG